ncbi:hypothetical protein AB0J72_13750 [Dactylosporangium sp. NPDC049742]|uniref:hypothetical protein n=1 Tax=Dactylosporangium sp. NPDC049742 TaxID=3154737 RepID=UPI00342B7B0C
MDFVLFLVLTVLLCGWLDQSPTTKRQAARAASRRLFVHAVVDQDGSCPHLRPDCVAAGGDARSR